MLLEKRDDIKPAIRSISCRRDNLLNRQLNSGTADNEDYTPWIFPYAILPGCSFVIRAMGDGWAGILGTINSSQNLAYLRCSSCLFESETFLPPIRLYIP